eukprot:3110880-Amphidinium_carterae.1
MCKNHGPQRTQAWLGSARNRQVWQFLFISMGPFGIEVASAVKEAMRQCVQTGNNEVDSTQKNL